MAQNAWQKVYTRGLIEISTKKMTSMLCVYVCKHTYKNILKFLLHTRTLLILAFRTEMDSSKQ